MIRARLLFAIACLSFVAMASPAGAQTQVSPKTGSGIVTGTVNVDGKPAPNVSVVLAVCDSQSPRKYPPPLTTKTNDEGKFYLDSVPAGRYCINAFIPTFAYESRTFDFYGNTFSVSDGETVDGITLSLIKGGVITGRVTGPDGRPVIEERVQIYGVEAVHDFSGGAITDDRGIYRAYGLPTGNYIVSAGSTEAREGSRVTGPRLRTFYPGLTDQNQAKPVSVVAGQETKDIDIVCGHSPGTYRATGTVVDAKTGAPIPGAGIALLRINPGTGPSERLFVPSSDKKGEFTIESISSGNYVVRLGYTNDLNAYSEDVPFEITNQDVTGLVVKALPAPLISGIVELEGDSSPALRSQLFENNLFPSNVDANQHDPGHAPAHVNPDGTFKIIGLHPGRYWIALYSSQSVPFVLLRTERGSMPVTGGIDLQKDEPITDVRLVFGYANGSIRGSVKAPDIGKSAGHEIWIDIRSVDRPNTFEQIIKTDVRNQFNITRLLPGQYEVAVHEFIYATIGTVRMMVSSDKKIVQVSNNTELTVDLTAFTKPYRENEQR